MTSFNCVPIGRDCGLEDCTQIKLLIKAIKSTEGCDESDSVDSLDHGVPRVCSACS